tara:strand:+ start:487 stop:1953 length:1467 start_codon:yes stop_codon:yes gene_type:complete
MLIRTYIDKDNTIIKDAETNTGRNEIAELYYGGHPSTTQYTRHLFYFDVSDLQSRYNSGELGDLSNVTHILKMTNTSSFDEDLIAQKSTNGYQRAGSFDLILFRVNQFWDQGCGYDYKQYNTQQNDEITFVNGASNWLYPTSTTQWEQTKVCKYDGLTGSTCDGVTGYTEDYIGGVYAGSPSAITVTTQHFDIGNEDIEMDITDEVNSLITGGTTNYGYGLSFERDLETLVREDAKYIGFFKKETQTYYEPFVETLYDNAIRDDRNRFYKGKSNKLYLYVNIGGQLTNLDNTPSVVIRDEDDDIFASFTTGQTTHITTGVYSVELTVPVTNEDCVLYTDTWSDLKINGVDRNDVTLDFEVKDDETYFDLGTNVNEPVEYYMSVSGIKNGEKIKRGDIRKVFASARKPFTTNEIDVIDGLQYRLYVKEGNTEVNVIDWMDINRTFDTNYFLIDTSWMIPNIYYVDVKLSSGQEVRTYSNSLKFEIVNQK